MGQRMKRLVPGIYYAGKVQPLEPLDLPEDTRVTIVVEDGAPAGSHSPDPMATIWEIARDIGPPDLAANLDRYLYGSDEESKKT